MAENWTADVKKFAPDADDGVIAAIVRYCGIALQNRDSSLVSFTDPVETGRVRENFLKKKLGLVQADSVLDDAIAAVGQKMKGVNFKNRVTVYYLLLEHFGLLHLFGGKPVDGGAGIAAAGAGAAGAAALGLAGLDGPVEAAVPPPPIPPAPTAPEIRAPEIASPASPAMAYAGVDEEEKSGLGWWPWLILGLLLLALLWWFFLRPHPVATGDGRTYSTTGGEAVSGDVAGAPALNTAVAANASAAASLPAAPAEGSVTIPTGAGVTTETRDGKPVVKVYFDTGKTEIAPAFAAAAGGLQTYLGAHAGTSLAVSGYNDKTGNAAANAELSKKRAQAVKAALVSAGIADGSVALVKPSDTTDVSTSDAAARRVEVVVK